jgi:hypothetical protein
MKIKSKLIGALLLGSFLVLDCSKATNNQDAILLSLINPNPENPSSTSNTSSFVFVNVRLFDKATEAPGSGSGSFSDPQKAINGVFGCGKIVVLWMYILLNLLLLQRIANQTKNVSC